MIIIKNGDFIVENHTIQNDGKHVIFNEDVTYIENDVVFSSAPPGEAEINIETVNFHNVSQINGALDFAGCKNLKLIIFGNLTRINGYLMLPSDKVGLCIRNPIEVKEVFCFGDLSLVPLRNPDDGEKITMIDTYTNLFAYKRIKIAQDAFRG
jgi:filamentous hemagglutinin family protein